MNPKHKIYILGDSFCAWGYPMDGKVFFWGNQLHKEFEETHDLIVDAFPSRDVQTILDNWIKILPRITKDDIFVACIPFFIRIRVPLAPKDYMINEYGDLKIVNRFITHHSWYTTESQYIYLNDNPIEKEDLNDKVLFFERMCYNNESVEKNYNEVIESLYKLTPAKKYLFSWDNMKYQTDVIEYKDKITEKLGWTTLNDLYIETNGKWGREADLHWHPEFEITFGNYLVNKFKK